MKKYSHYPSILHSVIHWSAILLALFSLLLLTSPVVSAESYRATMYNGDIYTLNVGDTLYLTSSLSTDDLDLSARGWEIDRDDVVGIEYTANSKYATVTALEPGTATVKALVDGSYKVPKTGTRYNNVTDKWESYTYYVYEPIGTRSCYVIVRVIDTLSPVITSQPASKAFASGATATVSVSASDHSAISYQWYYKDPGSNSFSKSSITGRTYSFTMSSAKSGRQVYCVITDALGNTTKSKTATLSQITITTQPTNKTVAPGVTVKTTVTASGEGLKYQWYFADPGSAAYAKSSITSSTYAFPMTTAKSGRQAYCIITDKYGNSMKTNTVILRQEVYVTITKQPKSDFSASGEKVSASVTATGDGLKYQWYVKNPGSSSFGKSSITERTYSYSMTGAKSGRQAYCVVTDKYGNSVKSNTVTFSLFAITKQPYNVAVDTGKTASTTVTVSGSGLKYQWYVKNPGSSSYSKSSTTGKTYSFSMTVDKSGRQAYCVITDKYGNSLKTNTVTLKIRNYAKITAQPSSVMVPSDKLASVSVTATGDGLKYQWYVNDPGTSTFGKSSVTSKTYGFTMTAAKSGRKVYCVVTDTYGTSVKTNTVTLSMAAPITITTQPADIIVAKDTTATVSVSATGQGALKYQWYVKNIGESSFSKSSITGTVYSVTMDSTRNGRQVYCLITDNYGQEVRSLTVTLTQLKPLVITSQPQNYYKSAYTGSVKFSVSVSGTGPFTYEWYYWRPGYSSFVKTNHTNDTYPLINSTPDNNGFSVYCIVYDNYGQSVTSDTASLTVYS